MGQVKLSIKNIGNGLNKVFINDEEIDGVEECVLDIDARRKPMASLRLHCSNIDIDTFINEEAVDLQRYEYKRIKPSLNTAFDKAFDKKNS